jgi:hypothetical protein
MWAKMAGSASGGGYEMCAFGRTLVEGNECVITDAYMTKHEGTAGSFEADDEDLCMLMMKLNGEGIPPDEAFRTWVHSHPGTGEGATYLSSTDEAMIDRFMSGDFLVSIVFDSNGEHPFCRIDTKNPRMSIVAELEVYYPYLTAAEIKANKELFKEKSSKKTYIAQPSKYVTSKPKHQRGGYQFQAYQGGYGGGYDSSSYPSNTDRRTGSYSSIAEPTTSSSKPSTGTQLDIIPDKAEGEVKGIADLSFEELRQQFAEIFDLDDEDVQDQWLKWIAESDGFEDLFDIIETASEEKREKLSAEEWYDTKEADGVVIINLPAEDDEDYAHDGLEPAPILRAGTAALELLDADSEGNGVPDADTSQVMTVWSTNLDLDSIAQEVVEARMTKEDAIGVAVARHNLSQEEAEAAIELRVG